MNLNLTTEQKRYIYNSDVEVPIGDMICQEFINDSFSSELHQETKKERTQLKIQDKTLELTAQQTSQIQNQLITVHQDSVLQQYFQQSEQNWVKKLTHEQPSQLITEDPQQELKKSQINQIMSLSENQNHQTKILINKKINEEKLSTGPLELIKQKNITFIQINDAQNQNNSPINLSNENSQLLCTSQQEIDNLKQNENQPQLAFGIPDQHKDQQKIKIKGVQRQYVLEKDIEKTPQYQCQLCTLSFEFGRTYRDHLKFFHEENAAFKCPSCDFFVNQPEQLSNHLLEIHKIYHEKIKGRPIYECPFTKQLFRKKNALLKNIRNTQQYFDPRSNKKKDD